MRILFFKELNLQFLCLILSDLRHSTLFVGQKQKEIVSTIPFPFVTPAG